MQPVTHLADAKRKPDPEVIEALERLLERARSGELIGFVQFSFLTENGCAHHEYGDSDFSAILVAFESWKYLKLKENEP